MNLFNTPRKKKGDVEIQFNYIFVMIVGAILLAGIIALVFRLKASSETEISGTVMTQLNSIFVGAQQSAGTLQNLTIPEVELSFDCLGFDVNGVSRGFGNRLVFAPEK